MTQKSDMDDYLVTREITVLGAIEALQKSPKQFVLVVDETGKLVGSLTDGDIRRALLRGVKFENPITIAMNPNPVYVFESSGEVSRPGVEIELLPVLDDAMRPLRIRSAKQSRAMISTPVLLMAGGRGTRLMPYTRDTPKPLVEIHGKSLIEMLIERFRSCGFNNFFISVNHMADQITQRLQDGSRMGVEIEYVFESNPLGTAGALGLIRNKVEDTVLVANADLVTGCDFRSFLRFHQESSAALTVATRTYVHQVPFGVVEADDERVRRVIEKPTCSSQVSAGIYAVSRPSLDLIAENQKIDMPEFISLVMQHGAGIVAAFPIHEQWHDVGHPEELEMLRSQDSSDPLP